MGKKSSDAVEIDPRYYDALEQQNALALKQQQWYEGELYPWMKQQTLLQNQYSEQDRQIAQQNYQFWQDYASKQMEKQNQLTDEMYDRWKDKYLPVEDSLIADAARYNTSAEAERQAQRAIADVGTAYAAQRQADNMRMQQYGINPTSGLYQGQNRAMGINQASLSAAAANQARNAAQELGWNKKSQIAALGQGYLGNTLQTTSNAANAAGNYAIQSLGQANAMGQQGLANITNTANVGLNSYSNLSNAWGNIANGYMDASTFNYNKAANSDNAKTQTIGTAIGGAATVAAAMF